MHSRDLYPGCRRFCSNKDLSRAMPSISGSPRATWPCLWWETALHMVKLALSCLSFIKLYGSHRAGTNVTLQCIQLGWLYVHHPTWRGAVQLQCKPNAAEVAPSKRQARRDYGDPSSTFFHVLESARIPIRRKLHRCALHAFFYMRSFPPQAA